MKYLVILPFFLVGCLPTLPDKPPKPYVFTTKKVIYEDGKEEVIVEFPDMDKRSGGPFRLYELEYP